MKVSFSIPLKPISGKQKFAILLANEMKQLEVKITNKNPDINLVFVKGVRKKCKNIFRLDGIWMNTRINFKKKNKGLHTQMRQCDGVIYQSQFCKKAGDKFLGKVENYKVILNGSRFPGGVNPYIHSRPYILTFSRWRPHKRLKETVDGFLESGLSKDFDLLVVGKKPDYIVKNDTVKYMGYQSKDLWSIILGSVYTVHLAYIDWCPNSVVEALVAGKNVLHTSSGGTSEIVRKNGIQVQDRKWNFKALDLYNPPSLDRAELIKAYQKMLLLSPAQWDYLDIRQTAQEYICFCESVLR